MGGEMSNDEHLLCFAENRQKAEMVQLLRNLKRLYAWKIEMLEKTAQAPFTRP